ncbi:tripartite tricarboxylate transporter TctB family protein [Aliihoeflea sp. 2WW]|uniref:tripartite tricarboxylate transporter TctB family protein n=1 Tax=Aliihoeflea sp. 2WW TaxID=1381123 RepID=UPI000464401B|nr:tripartite tricarboxylate transporter TctB family protein [Aliihoeflea sp. 2WW]
MNKPDIWIGALLLGVALAALVEGWGFASVPGMGFGAWTFPSVISLGLAVASTALIVTSMVAKPVGGGADEVTPEKLGMRDVAGLVLVAVAPIAYILAAPTAGFFICASVIMTVLSLWFWGGLIRCFVLALIAAGVLELIFARAFMVPLPRGWFSIAGMI